MEITPEEVAMKSRMKSIWMAGDFGEIGHYLETEAQDFVERLRMPAGSKVLDVACGTGNSAIPAAKAGATVTGGERVTVPGHEGGYYVRPALVESERPFASMQEETFAPILYIVPYDGFAEALALQNQVRQGLSSAIFTNNMQERH